MLFLNRLYLVPALLCLFANLFDHVSDTLATQNFPQYYRAPLDLPMNLSGNYGEFRSNHFHTGYDMRIGGVVGARLYAVADGFISRISVSPGGYGNGLYIDHPNGTTSVYGHLLDFAPAIHKYVKEKQYEQRSYSVDFFLSPDVFPVRKGDFIGRAGNSGASNGPHLHFELRNSITQTTLNYSAHKLYPVPDYTPPVLNRLQLYSYSLQSGIPRVALIKAVDLRTASTPIPVSDTFYVAMGAYDRMEGSPMLLSLAKYEVYLDDHKVYKYEKQDVPANHGRYLNSFVQYSQRVEFDRTLLKTWVEPGNVLNSFVESSSKGLFVVSDSLEHQLKIVLTDDYGNSSTYRYKVVRKVSEGKHIYPIEGKRLLWALDNYYETESLRLYLPFGALGKNIDLNVESVEPSALSETTFYTPLWCIGTPSEPLLKPMRLSLYAPVSEELREKAIIVSVSKEHTLSAAGGKWNGDFLEINTYNFGNYTITVDTIPPLIVPRFSGGADLRRTQQLRFSISDNLSGINSFEGYIDGAWVLFAYDPRYRTLTYSFDKERIESAKKHTLELRVTDNCNNTSVFKTDFIW